MTLSSVIRSFSLAKAAGVCALGLGLVLGGCNKQLKQEHADLMTQNSALIAENNQLKTNQDAMQSRLKEVEDRMAASASPPQTGMNGWDGSTGSTGRSGSPGRDGRDGRNTTIVIAGDVLFDSGQATIKASARKELDTVASRLRSRHSGQDIRVEGYTDTDPIRKSKWGSNEALSEARAEAVRNYLVSKGISSGQISAVGMGAAKPKGNKKDSRRVEIVVIES